MQKFLIGITGGIGSGKSFVCKILEKMGYPVFYSDKISKTLLANDDLIINKVKNLLGHEAYCANGSVNKEFIASKIFNSPEKLEGMNAIMHPAVRKAFKEFSEKQNTQLVFNEAAIIFETGSFEQFYKTILVTAPKSIKMKRIIKRDDVSEEQVKTRMSNQWSDDQKIPLADYIISNGESDMILSQIIEIIDDILK